MILICSNYLIKVWIEIKQDFSKFIMSFWSTLSYVKKNAIKMLSIKGLSIISSNDFINVLFDYWIQVSPTFSNWGGNNYLKSSFKIVCASYSVVNIF